MEINVIQRIVIIPIMFLYFFAPELSEVAKGKFSKTITITLFSILLATRLDLQYFITNYPLRAIAILAMGLVILIIYLKHNEPLKKFNINKKFKRLKTNVAVSYSRFLNLIYFFKPAEYIETIEKNSFSFVWNNIRILIFSILIFDHVSLKFLLPSFGVIFLVRATLYSLLSTGKTIKTYPAITYTITFLLPWAAFLSLYFFSVSSNIKPYFLDDNFLVWLLWMLGIESYKWLTSTIVICIFTSLGFIVILTFWAVLSVLVKLVLEVVIQLLKLGIIQLPIFSRQKRKAQLKAALKIKE